MEAATSDSRFELDVNISGKQASLNKDADDVEEHSLHGSNIHPDDLHLCNHEELELEDGSCYNRHHKILVVGEDDFSFSASLATSLGSASNMVAASPDSRDKVTESHFEAKKNMEILEERGAILLHQMVDIHMTNSTRPELEDKLFDRILLRFPHSVFGCSLEGNRYIKESEQDVVLGLCNSTKYLLADNGEIHAIHKKLEESDHGCGLDFEDVDNNVKGDCDRSDCKDQGAVEGCAFVVDDLATKDLDNSKGMDDVKESADDDKLCTKNTDVISIPEHKNDDKLVSQKRCIGGYDSRQKILLVGEGDFSFSSCLADAFISASNLTATSLDSRETVVGRYSKGEGHLRNLEERGAVVIHQVDVHTMNNHPQLMQYTPFDRIIYNFPHAGGYRAMECQTAYIECHRRVVSGFFTAARWMLTDKGEIHVTHKTTHPYDRWKIVELAESVGLAHSAEVGFRSYNYPGYENKKAYGLDWDATFLVGQASTFVFCTTS